MGTKVFKWSYLTLPKAPIPRFFPSTYCPICTGGCSMVVGQGWYNNNMNEPPLVHKGRCFASSLCLYRRCLEVCTRRTYVQQTTYIFLPPTTRISDSSLNLWVMNTINKRRLCNFRLFATTFPTIDMKESYYFLHDAREGLSNTFDLQYSIFQTT